MNAMLSVWDALQGDFFRGLGESGLMWVTQAGLAALPFALVVLLANLLGRRWLSAGQMGLLWCLVLMRLLLPSAPASPLSLHNLLRGSEPVAVPSERIGIDFDFNAEYARASAPGAEPVSGTILPHPTTMPIPGGDWEDFKMGMSELLWLASAVAIFAWTLFVHARFCRRVRQAPLCRDERLLRLWDDCCQAAGIRSRPPITIFYGVQQPAVTGLLHPELLLPPESLELSDDELRMIMLHELAHVRRWDIAINWGLVVLRATHWWNPVYWLAAARFRSLREQACDAFVIRAAQGQTSRDYSELLLKLAQQPGGSRWRVMVPASLLGLFESYFRKREIRVRLKALRTVSAGHSRWHQVAFGAVVVLAALCGLTDAQPSPSRRVDYEALPASDWLPPGTDLNSRHGGRKPEPFQGPLEVRSYASNELISRSTPEDLEAAGGRHALGTIAAFLLARSRPMEIRSNVLKLPLPGEETPGGSFQWDGDRLIVRAPKGLHDELATVCQAWETSGAAQIMIECRLMTSPVRELGAAAGIEWQSLASDPGLRDEPLAIINVDVDTVVRATSRVEDHVPVFVASLNEKQMKTIIETAQKEPRASVISGPNVTVWNGEEATVFCGVNRPFVVGLDEKTGAEPQPRIETIDEGTKIRLRPVLSADCRHIRLTGFIDLTSIVNVASIQASMAGGIRSVQAPRVRHSLIAIASQIEDGRSLLIRCSPTFENTDGLYVLLTPRRLEPAKE